MLCKRGWVECSVPYLTELLEREREAKRLKQTNLRFEEMEVEFCGRLNETVLDQDRFSQEIEDCIYLLKPIFNDQNLINREQFQCLVRLVLECSE